MSRLHNAAARASAALAPSADVVYISSDDDSPTNNGKLGEGVPRSKAFPSVPSPVVSSSGALPQLPPCDARVSSNGRRWTGWNESIKKSSRVVSDNAEHQESTNTNSNQARSQAFHIINQAGQIPHAATPKRLTYWIRGEPGKYWSHNTYRGPQNAAVKIIYCKTRAESEKAAQLFLAEPVVGFDMEWKSRKARGIKGNISLIQVGCEDKIALFHIALHAGASVSELIAPTLRKLIESPSIAKTGVAINNADGQRLRRYMRLEPRGMFELSFLHRVVKYGRTKPELVNKKLVKLTYLARDHLGRPLHKGPVRTSDWTKPLTQEQINYAADDAYAGFRLYHAMETKRLRMSPVPPRPDFAELALPLLLSMPVQDDVAEAGVPCRSDEDRLPRRDHGQPSVGVIPVVVSPTTAATNLTAKRALSALKALRKRISIKTGRPEPALATDEVLLQIVNVHVESRSHIEQTSAYVAWKELLCQHEIDLAAFLVRHAPCTARPRPSLNATTLLDGPPSGAEGLHALATSDEDDEGSADEDDEGSGESDDEPAVQVSDGHHHAPNA